MVAIRARAPVVPVAMVGGGIVIAESDDPAEGYANLLNYGQWMEFETKVMLKVEDAVPLIGAYLG